MMVFFILVGLLFLGLFGWVFEKIARFMLHFILYGFIFYVLIVALMKG